MASKNITKDLPTLVLAVLLGAGVAWWRTEAVPDLREGTRAPVRSLATRGSGSAVTSSSSRLPSHEAVACASAWESIDEIDQISEGRENGEFNLAGAQIDFHRALIFAEFR